MDPKNGRPYNYFEMKNLKEPSWKAHTSRVWWTKYRSGGYCYNINKWSGPKAKSQCDRPISEKQKWEAYRALSPQVKKTTKIRIQVRILQSRN